MSFFHKFSSRHNKPEAFCANTISRRVLRLEPLEDRELLSSDGSAGAATPVVILETPTELASCDVSVAVDDEQFIEDEPVGDPSVVDACYDNMANELCDSFAECELDAISIAFSEIGEDEIDEYDSSPLFSLGLDEDDEVFDEEPDVVEEEGSGGEASGGSGSSGGTNSGGSSSGGTSGGSGGTSGGSGGSGGHSHVNHAPYYTSIPLDFSDLGSGGSVMRLTTSETQWFSIGVIDGDEATYGVDESVTLGYSGSAVEGVFTNKIGNTYIFTVGVNISNPGDLHATFWASDRHGLRTREIELNYDLVRIDGFEIQEKAPGESDFHTLVDSHVVWKENENRLHFLTTPQIDYNNASQLSTFESLFHPRVKKHAWNWSETSGGYSPSSGGWVETSVSSPLGVYDVKVELYASSTSNTVINQFEHDQYYCFNEISSVEWDTTQAYPSTDAHLAILSDSSGGMKAYVEQTLNTTTGAIGVVKNIATVNVTLACVVPSNLQATVNVMWFDPDNPMGSTKTPTSNGYGVRDNHGSITSLIPATLTFNLSNGTKTRSAALTIGSGYAGDNYIIAAHPNAGVLSSAEIESVIGVSGGIEGYRVAVTTTGSGGVGSGGVVYWELKTSPVLTVWRTLWVERDKMSLAFQSGLEFETDYAPIDGVVGSELARACISIENYLPNLNPTVTGTEFADASLLCSKRNSPLSTDSFWTVQLTSAFRSVNDDSSNPDNTLPNRTHGIYYKEEKVIGIFYWTIDGQVELWNNYCLYPTQLIDSDGRELLIRSTVLHEIGHALGLSHYDNGQASVMKSQRTIPEQLSVEYNKFSEEQICEIQSHSKPQDPVGED